MIFISTKEIKIGNVIIGGCNPVVIQSMTNTKTKDINSTIKQINDLKNAGAQIVRMTISDIEDANAISEIKKQVDIPLVGDIHFDYKLALLAIENGIDKIRINPGNIGSFENVKKIIEKSKEKNQCYLCNLWEIKIIICDNSLNLWEIKFHIFQTFRKKKIKN